MSPVRAFVHGLGIGTHPQALAAADKPWRRMAIGLVLLLAAALLVAALTQPVLTITAFFQSRPVSVYQAIETLWREDERLLAILVVVFSIVFPGLKLWVTGIAYVGIARRHADRLLGAVAGLAKWSMAEVFVVAITIVTLKASTFADVRAEQALYYFLVVFLLSALAARLVRLASLDAPPG